MNKVRILKGVNKGFRFKGLIGKYVIATVVVVFISFIFIMISSMFVSKMYLIVLFFVVFDSIIVWNIFRLNNKYGENGLEVVLSSKLKPNVIVINTRKYLDIKFDETPL